MIVFPAEGNCLDQQNRKKPFPESAVRVIAWDGLVRATAKAGLNDIKCCNSKDAPYLTGNAFGCMAAERIAGRAFYAIVISILRTGNAVRKY